LFSASGPTTASRPPIKCDYPVVLWRLLDLSLDLSLVLSLHDMIWAGTRRGAPGTHARLETIRRPYDAPSSPLLPGWNCTQLFLEHRARDSFALFNQGGPVVRGRGSSKARLEPSQGPIDDSIKQCRVCGWCKHTTCLSYHTQERECIVR
jgi:hypothetical protein